MMSGNCLRDWPGCGQPTDASPVILAVKVIVYVDVVVFICCVGLCVFVLLLVHKYICTERERQESHTNSTRIWQNQQKHSAGLSATLDPGFLFSLEGRQSSRTNAQ